MPYTYDAGPPSSPDEYIQHILSIHSNYELDSILVWEDMEGIGYANFDRYMDFYNEFYDQFHAFNPTVKLYGPNIDVEWVGSLDPDHEQMLLDFMEQAHGFDALAFRADLSESDWADLITYVKTEIWDGPLVVTIKGSPSDPAPIHEALSPLDIALWPASVQDGFSYESVGSYWKFEGTLTLNTVTTNFRVRTDIMTNPLRGLDRSIQIWTGSLDGDLVYDQTLPSVNNTVVLGSLGVEDTPTTYYYRISGMPASTGAGILKVSFLADNLTTKSVQGSLTVVG